MAKTIVDSDGGGLLDEPIKVVCEKCGTTWTNTEFADLDVMAVTVQPHDRGDYVFTSKCAYPTCQHPNVVKIADDKKMRYASKLKSIGHFTDQR